MLLAEVDRLVAENTATRAEAGGMEMEIAAAHQALDAMPGTRAPEVDTVAERVRFATRQWLDERAEASHLASLCQLAHDALDHFGLPTGKPHERIHALAMLVEGVIAKNTELRTLLAECRPVVALYADAITHAASRPVAAELLPRIDEATEQA
jgi:hypothetical protein